MRKREIASLHKPNIRLRTSFPDLPAELFPSSISCRSMRERPGSSSSPLPSFSCRNGLNRTLSIVKSEVSTGRSSCELRILAWCRHLSFVVFVVQKRSRQGPRASCKQKTTLDWSSCEETETSLTPCRCGQCKRKVLSSKQIAVESNSTKTETSSVPG